MLFRAKMLLRNLLRGHQTQIIVITFLAMILIGAVLLSLPVSTRSGQSAGLLTALFTSTSATCVTGLVLVDTHDFWSPFGQAVILLLIQMGGLGFVTMATLFSFVIRRNISYNERLLMRESLNTSGMQGIVRMTRNILIGTFLAEGVGAIVLSIRLIPQFGLAGGIVKSVFCSVSAFCNAGFDIFGGFNNLTGYVTDPLVSITIMGLVVSGGLGFIVWSEVFSVRDFRKLHLQSKIVLIMTGALIAVGAALFLVLEYNNPETIGNLGTGNKVLASLFQSVTTRTAGFNTISQAGLTDSSKLVSILLMFVGGSPGSTAGGIKTVTLAVLIMAVRSVMRGSSEVAIFERRISHNVVLRSLAIVIIGLTVVLAGTMVLSFVQPQPFIDILFEVVSAFGTVGITAGMTPHLTTISKVAIMLIMFMGRVGVLSVALSLTVGMNSGSPDKIKYPEEKLTVG